jgi:hypothetical protein
MGIQQLGPLAFCVYAVGLAVATYFTRPKSRRLVGALVGGLAIVVAGVGVEGCQSPGFWRYPSIKQRACPLAMYPVLVVMWAVYPLIGWRAMRRLGWRGEFDLLAMITLVRTLRDYLPRGKPLG